MWAFLLIQAAFFAVLIWGAAASSSIDCSQAVSEYECAQQNDLAAGIAALGIIFWWVVADLALLACYGIWKVSDPGSVR